MALDELTIPESVTRRADAFERFGAVAAVLDADGVVVETNAAWRLFAALNDARPGTTGPGSDYLAVCDRAAAAGLELAHAVAEGIRDILGGERHTFELEYPCPSAIEDRWFLLHATTTPVHGATGVVLLHVNTTARRLLEERLAQDLHRDPVTGLPDRSAAIALIDATRSGDDTLVRSPTVIHLALAGLGRVVDEIGTPAAEELLIHVTARASRALRAHDHLCRVDTSTLALVCPDLDDDGAMAIADRLQDVLAVPFQIGTVELTVEAAVTVAAAGSGTTGTALLDALASAEHRFVRHTPRAGRHRLIPTRRLDAARAQRDAVVAHSDDLVMFFEADGTIAWASPATRTLFGVDPDALVGQNGIDTIHPDDQERVVAEFATLTSRGDHVRVRFRINAPDGTVHWIEETATNYADDPDVGYVVGNLHDVTARKRDEDAIRLRSRLLDAAGQAIVAVDNDGVVLYWNAAATHIYGWTADEAAGRRIGDLLPPAVDWIDEATAIQARVDADGQWSGDFWIRRKDGVNTPVFVTNTPVHDDAGVKIGMIGVASDITDRKRLELHLWRQATHDSLTGLPNRSLLLEKLDTAIDTCPTESIGVGVLCIDVDRFKLINDSLGHDRGDQLLVAMAEMLHSLLDPGMIAARFDSDTFAVVIPTLASSEQALALAEHIRRRLADGLVVAAERYSPTVSIGMVVAQPDDDAITVLRDGDTAMYRAKERGRDRAEWFDPSLRRPVVTIFEVERDLRDAIEHGQLRVVYQPVFDFEQGEIHSCEALVRWRHPTRGELDPDEFIPVAETSGLIVPLGSWVLRQALTDAAGWPDTVHVAVNVSPRQLAEPSLFDLVRDTLTDVGVAPSRLVLEITETAVLQDPTAAARTIASVRGLGVRVVIDDFGTGYTSLSFLRDYHLDGLKVDRSFITDIAHGSTAIVDAIIRMAGALGMSVIAEGIETEEQLTMLRDLGCRFIQGYLVGRPVAPELLPFSS